MLRIVDRVVLRAIAAGTIVMAVSAVREAFASRPSATAVFAGGCYWGIDAVFRHVRGVSEVTSGFAVPVASASSADPHAAHSGYAEAVRVVYDPTTVTYEDLLAVFFLVAHDPTELDRQGPDVGPEYRSAVFISDTSQQRVVLAYVAHLVATKAYPRPIVTEIVKLGRFKEAEGAQQDYVVKHPTDPYIVKNDAPKVVALERRFPALYRG